MLPQVNMALVQIYKFIDTCNSSKVEPTLQENTLTQ